MATDVRTVSDGEFEAWMAAMAVGFLAQPREGAAEFRRPHFDLDRTWGAFDGDRVVGTLRSWASELTLPGGGSVDVGALTNVTVTSTHRRQGLLTRMIQPELQASVERGEAAGILIASEYPIYGRFGYGPATEHVTTKVHVRSVRFGARPPGSVELTDLAELRKLGPGLYEQVQRRVAGSISRREHWWDQWCELTMAPGDERFKGYVVVGRDERGEPDGYVRYTVDDKWVDRRPQVTLTVDELLATSPAAYERLWRLCCEVDWVVEVVAHDRPVDEPLPWLLADGRAVEQAARSDFVWLRPLDVAALLSARTYFTTGRVVLEVVDDLGLASGRFALEGGPDGATCSPTTETAGVTLPVTTLGAISLGGHPLRLLTMSGRGDVHDDRALAVADAMFRTPAAPWCFTWF